MTDLKEIVQLANVAGADLGEVPDDSAPNKAARQQLGLDAANYLAQYVRNAAMGDQQVNEALAAGKVAQKELDAAAAASTEEEWGVMRGSVPESTQAEIAGIEVPQDVHALQRTVEELRARQDDAQKQLDKYTRMQNLADENLMGLPGRARGRSASSPVRKSGQFLRDMNQRMHTAPQLQSFAAVYLGDLAAYLQKQDSYAVYEGHHDLGNVHLAKLSNLVQSDLVDTRPWFVWADDNVQKWENGALKGFGFYGDQSGAYNCFFLDTVNGEWVYKDAADGADLKHGSEAADQALQRIYSSNLVGSTPLVNSALEALVQAQASGNAGGLDQGDLMNRIAVAAGEQINQVRNVSVNSLVKTELNACVKDLEWKQHSTAAGLTDDEGRALRVYKEALGLQNPTDAETFLSQVKESLAYKDFTYKMSTLGLISRVNTLYNIVYTLQDFWKQIMYTDMGEGKRKRWRNWVRRRLDMVQQYIEDRDNIMGKNGDLLKSARKKLEKQADGLMLERTWAAIYIAMKYLDLALRNKEAPLFFEARPLSQDEAMTRLKADGGWGKASLRTQRPDDNEAVKLCQAEGIKVRYFDTHWNENSPGQPMLDPHDPADARKIEAYLKSQSGRLVVDCEGLVVSHRRSGDKHLLRLPMPQSIPVSVMSSTMPFMSTNKRTGRVQHVNPAINEALRYSIVEAEIKDDSRLKKLGSVYKYHKKHPNTLPPGAEIDIVVAPDNKRR